MSTITSSGLSTTQTASPRASEAASSPSDQPRGSGIRQMVSDLSRRMSKRSTPEELTQKHILPGIHSFSVQYFSFTLNHFFWIIVEAAQHTVASNILQAKQALEQEKAKNTLNRKLSLRPTKDDLKLRNIIKGNQNDCLPTFQEYQWIDSKKKQPATKTLLQEALPCRPTRFLLLLLKTAIRLILMLTWKSLELLKRNKKL